MQITERYAGDWMRFLTTIALTEEEKTFISESFRNTSYFYVCIVIINIPKYNIEETHVNLSSQSFQSVTSRIFVSANDTDYYM